MIIIIYISGAKNATTMLRLSTAEEKVMLVLWKFEYANVNQIVDLMPDPKPATNTISTFLAILEKKGYVTHSRKGRSFIYSPKISKLEYLSVHLKDLLVRYFNNDIEKFKNYIDVLNL